MNRVGYGTLIAAMVIILAACSKPGAPAPATAANSRATPAADAHETITEEEAEGEGAPCSLLEPKEVEAVLGEPLATPAFTRLPDEKPRVAGCHYVGADLREVVVDVTWSGAAMIWKMLGMVQGAIDQHAKGLVKLADGTELAGEWDEARVRGCCTFMAMRGDQIVEVDVAGSRAGIKEAASLADSALKRIDKPLALRSADGSAAAKFYAATRPKHRTACDLLSRADAEALLGPLAAAPQADGDKCHYELPPNGPLKRFVELSVQWQGGYRDLREAADLQKGVTGAMGMSVSQELPEELKSSGPPGWEGFVVGIDRFSAVKKDVLIQAGTRTSKQGDAEKLVAKAIGGL
ncbi:MAG: hypothetical protein U1F35_12520 [Steroidobacteraceae bacterium]